jgi:hypothetical protein
VRSNLMLKRYGEKAVEKSSAPADELAAASDHNGEAVWRISGAIVQLANNSSPGPVR